MNETNPYQSPHAESELQARQRRRLSPFVVYVLARVAFAGMTVATIGGTFVAAAHDWAIVPTALIFFYAVAAIWCWRTAVREKRRGLWR